MPEGAVTINLHFGGVDALNRKLVQMRANVADMRPAWATLRDRFVANMARTFAGEGGNSGKWQPLSPAYGAWKAAHYGNKPILQRTGELYRSLTSELAIDIREPQTMILGTDVPYARFHQTGTSRMPARPIIDLSQYERRLWVTVIRNHLFAESASGEVEAAA